MKSPDSGGRPTAARGGAILLAVLLIGSVLGYVFNMGLAWLLPEEDYGVYGAAMSLVGVLAAFVIHGFPWAATRFLAREEDPKKRDVVLKTALFGNVIVALLVIAVYLLLHFFVLRENALPLAVVLMVLGIVLLDAARIVYLRALHGQMQFEKFGVVSILEVVLRVGFGLAMVWLGFNTAGALSGVVFAGAVALAISAYLLRDMKFWRAQGHVTLTMLSFAWAALIGNFAMTILSQTDILVVKFLGASAVSDQAVGHYQAIRMLALIPLFFAGSIVGGVFPFISRLKGGESRTYSLFSLRYVLLIALPVTLVLAVLPGAVIGFFFPAAYSASADVLIVLAFSGVFIALIQVLLQLFQAMGKPGLPAVVLAVSTALQVALLVVLVPRLGLMGAAWAMVAASVVGAGWLLVAYMRLHHVPVRLSSVAGFAFTLALCGLVLYFFPHSNRLLMILDVAVAGVVYVGLAIAFGLVRKVDFDIVQQALPRNRAVTASVNALKGLAARFER